MFIDSCGHIEEVWPHTGPGGLTGDDIYLTGRIGAVTNFKNFARKHL